MRRPTIDVNTRRASLRDAKRPDERGGGRSTITVERIESRSPLRRDSIVIRRFVRRPERRRFSEFWLHVERQTATSFDGRPSRENRRCLKIATGANLRGRERGENQRSRTRLEAKNPLHHAARNFYSYETATYRLKTCRRWRSSNFLARHSAVFLHLAFVLRGQKFIGQNDRLRLTGDNFCARARWRNCLIGELFAVWRLSTLMSNFQLIFLPQLARSLSYELMRVRERASARARARACECV